MSKNSASTISFQRMRRILMKDVPSSAISLDPKLPDLLRQLPSLQKLGLFDMNWTVLPLLDAVKHCLAIPSLKTFVIASDEFPLGILEHCRHVKTLCLSGDANVSTEFNVNTPELRNLHLDIHSHEFRTVWRHLDTSKLEKLAVQHRLESYDQHTSIYPPECANLRSLTVTFSEDDPFEHDWIDDWPRFESLAELRELNVVYKTKVYEQDLEDRPERLAGWLGRIDPVMRQLECLNITFFVTFPDSIVSKEFEELQELDSQLACLQSATLKKVVIAVCPNDSEGSADPRKRYEAFGAAGLGASTEADGESEREEVWQALKLLDEVRGTPMEREVTERVMRALALVPERKGVTQEELEARTAGSVKVIWDSLKASRARAPDFISVKVCKSEDVPWYHKVLEE
ncbi:hypothetical protein H0H92_009420 [Tricholoma furcatifolium]|nr:hypothetical protein H0H92_009420 [Tricholoma furcatifolium]